MKPRTALLIRCSKDEVAAARAEARHDRRKLSSYVLNVLMTSIEFEEALFLRYKRLADLKLKMPSPHVPGRRTAFLLRCSAEEAHRIRIAAKRRDATISGFVLYLLRRAWAIQHGRRGHVQPERISPASRTSWGLFG